MLFFFQAEDGIRDIGVTGVQTCAFPISNLETSVWASVQAGRRLIALDLEEADSMMNRVSRAVAVFFSRYEILVTPVTAAPPIKLGTLGGNQAGIGARQWYDPVAGLCPFT